MFELSRELSSDDLIQKAKPEEYTKINLIKPILELIGCKIDTAERIFDGPRQTKREVDYTFTSKSGIRFILEAKPLNANLYLERVDGCVNQIIDAMKLHDVTKEFSHGIATDGMRWIFINNDRKIVADLNITKDFEIFQKILVGEIRPDFDKEEISRKFYNWYYALLYGGKYKDHEGKTRSIPRKESLVESIDRVPTLEEREMIAQAVMDRLIFIKFLESKRIIKESVINYLLNLPDNFINWEMRTLFFQVMTAPPSERKHVSPIFKAVPYLNGSLFIRNAAEAQFTMHEDYLIEPSILKEILRFLNSFTFTNRNDDSAEVLDPEILGYIFEMSMVSKDRKGTGAFYTPREITSYMSKEAIHSCFVSKVRDYLRTEGYNEADVNLVKTIDDVYNLPDIRLGNIFANVLPHIRICDNACGSGAFLLAAAEVLFSMYYTINAKSGLRNSDVTIKKLILGNNIFGVDLNPNAVEIAKLRLWLWVVDSFGPDHVEALPNIDYNVLPGDSLIGYVSIKDNLSSTISIDDYGVEENTVEELLVQKEKLVSKYRSQSGEAARAMKVQIEKINIKIRGKLTIAIYNNNVREIPCERSELFELNPFHWGLEFSEVFKEGGFDVIIGNPPYIPIQKIKSLAREFYESQHFKTYSNTGDIYYLFYERSHQIMKKGGILTYITSNSWMKTDAGQKLRDYFIKSTVPIQLIDIADLQIFKAATVECGIMTYSVPLNNVENQIATLNTCVLDASLDLSKLSEEVKKETLTLSFQPGSTWIIANKLDSSIMSKIEHNTVLLKDYGVRVYRGITTGNNDVFVIDENTKNQLEKDPNASKLIKPVYRGKEIQKYVSPPSGYWLLTTHNGDKKKNIDPVDVQKYPTVKKYLDQYYVQLAKRQDKGSTPYNLRNCSYMGDFEKTKIAWIDLTDEGRFSVIEPGTVFTDSVFFFAIDQPNYLLGILNSKLVSWYFSYICATSGAGTNRWKKQFVEQIPIPENPPNMEKIEKLVEKALKNPKDEDVLNQIDLEVCQAYGLSVEEAEYILEQTHSE